MGPDVSRRSIQASLDTVKMVCQLVIIVATLFNIQIISNHLAESPVTPAVASMYQSLEAYNHFRRLFIAMLLRHEFLAWLRLYFFNNQETEWMLEPIKESPVNQAITWGIYAAMF